MRCFSIRQPRTRISTASASTPGSLPSRAPRPPVRRGSVSRSMARRFAPLAALLAALHHQRAGPTGPRQARAGAEGGTASRSSRTTATPTTTTSRRLSTASTEDFLTTRTTGHRRAGERSTCRRRSSGAARASCGHQGRRLNVYPQSQRPDRAAWTRQRLDRFAELLVGFAANVQPGQVVAVSSEIGKERLTRAIAATHTAWRHLRRCLLPDPFVRRARVAHGPTPRSRPSVVDRRADPRARRPALRAHRADRRDRSGLLEDLDRARRRRRAQPARDRPGPQRRRPSGRSGPARRGLGRAVTRPAPDGRTRGCGSRSCTSAGSTRTIRSPPGASGWRR